jgi:hypothetical protein
MNRSNVAIYLIQYSNYEVLIERQYCQYTLYLHPDISVESLIWTVQTWAYIQYNILITRGLLIVNIGNIHYIWPLTFPLKLQYEP